MPSAPGRVSHRRPPTMPSDTFDPHIQQPPTMVQSQGGKKKGKGKKKRQDMPIADLAEQIRVAHAGELRQWLALPVFQWTQLPTLTIADLPLIFGYDRATGDMTPSCDADSNESVYSPSATSFASPGFDASPDPNGSQMHRTSPVSPLPLSLIPHIFNYPVLGPYHGRNEDFDEVAGPMSPLIVPDDMQPIPPPDEGSSNVGGMLPHDRLTPEALEEHTASLDGLPKHWALIPQDTAEPANGKLHFEPDVLSESGSARSKGHREDGIISRRASKHSASLSIPFQTLMISTTMPPFVPDLISQNGGPPPPDIIPFEPEHVSDSDDQPSMPHSINAPNAASPPDSDIDNGSDSSFEPEVVSDSASNLGSQHGLVFEPEILNSEDSTSDEHSEFVPHIDDDSEDSIGGGPMQEPSVAPPHGSYNANSFRDVPNHLLDADESE